MISEISAILERNTDPLKPMVSYPLMSGSLFGHGDGWDHAADQSDEECRGDSIMARGLRVLESKAILNAPNRDGRGYAEQ